MTCCVSTSEPDVKWLPSAAVAKSVLLKQHNSQMNATASVLGVLIKTGCMEVCHFFLILQQNSYISHLIFLFYFCSMAVDVKTFSFLLHCKGPTLTLTGGREGGGGNMGDSVDVRILFPRIFGDRIFFPYIRG